MAEAVTIVGVIASAIQIIDFTTTLFIKLNEYRSKSTELPSAFVHIANQLPILRQVLEKIKEAIENHSISPDEMKAIEPCVRGCKEQIEELSNALSAVLPDTKDRTMTRLTKAFRSLLRESDIGKVEKTIDSYVVKLTFYCTWSSSKLDSQNQHGLARAQQWLAPPDPYLNLWKSQKLRLANTGKWYLEGAQYQAWKAGGVPFTWLYGSAGSGKTILSAGIIDDLQKHCADDPAKCLAIFFFDFTDAEKQDPTNMVKSLLGQLLSGCTHVPEVVRSLQNTCENGGRQASEQQLLQALSETLDLLPESFVVLDALDECGDWDTLFDLLAEMQSWSKHNLRVLMTSRKEVQIQEALEDYVSLANTICLESHLVDKDIRTYVKERMAKDKSFKRWQKDAEIRAEIETTVGRKAHGMFRWAKCQLDTLAQCLTRGKVRQALKQLPKTLDETYERILRTIDEGQNADEAVKILTWLTYSERPLTATEVLEVTGIVIDENPRFDEEGVLQDPNDILHVCSSLVSVITARSDSDLDSDDDSEDDSDDAADDGTVHSHTSSEGEYTYVRLAHFSVKEYLVSSRVSIAKYSLPFQMSHDKLAKCCLVYLLRFDGGQWQSPDCESEFPLARYAAKHWMQHARAAGKPSQQQQDLSMELLTQDSAAFTTWLRFARIDFPEDSAPDIHRELYDLPSPLYAASLGDLTHIASAMLNAGADVNDQGGNFENALQVASLHGHEEIVQLLLNGGADVNCMVKEGLCGNALQAAASLGHENVVQLLLAAGADVNAQGGDYGNALQAASNRGYENVVQLLLAAGADVNAPSSRISALYCASRGGFEKVVQLLFAAGADVNVQGVRDNALIAASDKGHEKIVQLLLDAGATINGDTLYAAAYRGHETVVKLLLAAGADVNAMGGNWETALQGAATMGSMEIVQLLLTAGAEVDTTMLQTASTLGYVEIVQLFLAAGADVNAQGEQWRTALEPASMYGHQEIVQLLLAARTNVDA